MRASRLCPEAVLARRSWASHAFFTPSDPARPVVASVWPGLAGLLYFSIVLDLGQATACVVDTGGAEVSAVIHCLTLTDSWSNHYHHGH